MKIRQGFVSNSSSSSFWFCFKGKTGEELFTLLKKHKRHFDVRDYDGNHTSVDEVIRLISEKSTGKKNTVKVEKVSDLIANENEHVVNNSQEFVKNKKTEKKRDRFNMSEIYFESLFDSDRQVRRLHRCEEKGVNSFVYASFEDHSEREAILDMNRERLELDTDDLVIITRCDH